MESESMATIEKRNKMSLFVWQQWYRESHSLERKHFPPKDWINIFEEQDSYTFQILLTMSMTTVSILARRCKHHEPFPPVTLTVGEGSRSKWRWRELVSITLALTGSVISNARAEPMHLWEDTWSWSVPCCNDMTFVQINYVSVKMLLMASSKPYSLNAYSVIWPKLLMTY